MSRYLFRFLDLPLRAGLRAAEHTRPVFWASSSVTLFTLLTVYPLIQAFGLHGVMAGLLGVAFMRAAILLRGFLNMVSLNE